MRRVHSQTPMEPSYTLITNVGMLWNDQTPTYRYPKFDSVVPESWRKANVKDRDALISAIQTVQKQPSTTNDGRFPRPRNWGDVPALLVKALVNRRLPASNPEPQPGSTDDMACRIANNLVEIVQPVDLDFTKSLILNCRRVDVEQAVALTFRLVPEYVTKLVPLVPTIMTQSRMWLDINIPTTQDTDLSRRRNLQFLLSHAGVEHITDDTWLSLSSLLFRIRRNRPADASRGLRLPDWIQTYYTGDKKDLSWSTDHSPDDYPTRIIPDPIIVSKVNFRRLTRYVWRLLPNAPEKVLRREIQGLAQKSLYAQDARTAILATTDHAALAYTFLALERRLQLKIVSDLNGQFLKKGETGLFQQNTPYVPTSLEDRLAEIVMAQKKIDWTVFTAVQRPKGVDAVDSTDELVSMVDRVCTCFEDYVVIHGRGHTEPLRPKQGRYGGFRGPVDDWNAAVDILVDLRRRISDAGYQVVSKEDKMEDEESGFTIIDEVTAEETTDRGMDLPKAYKFLALDIMSWNKSWGDDVFALEKMPPEWWTWIQKRRAQGKCPLPLKTIVID